MTFRPLVLASLFVALPAAAPASADLVGSFEVGSGSFASQLQFDFANGDSWLYLVHWEGTTTGRDLFDRVQAAQPGFFDFATAQFPFGEALFSVSIGSDSDAGFGTPPKYLDYWHYYNRASSAEAWDYASSGFADRVVTDGSWDGWVFGSNDFPAAVPAPGGILLGLLALGGVRRRHSSLSRSLARTE